MVDKQKMNLELLLYTFEEKKQFYAINDPFQKLFISFDDIKFVLKSEKKLNAFKLLSLLSLSGDCFPKILTDKKEKIAIQYNNNKKGLSTYFYLNLLIRKNMIIIDYSNSIHYIKELYRERIQSKDKFEIIIMSKLICDLISNYKRTEEYKEEKNNDIESMNKENIMIVKNNLDVFESFGLNYNEKTIEMKKIDEIYIELIISLIKEKKLKNYDYPYNNILNKLDLININIAENMFDELFKILSEKTEYLSDYLILKFYDLFDEKKINFYFILLNNILKTSIYFYQIPLFLRTKKIIIKNLREINLDKISILNKNKNLIDKLEYIIKTLSDSEYYWNIYINNKFQEIREIQNYYKEFLFESKREDIKIIEEKIKNNENDFDIYLKDYELAKKMNLRLPIINYLYKEKCNEINKTEEKFNKEVISYNEIEKMIVDNKTKKMNRISKKILLNFFKDNNNKELLLKIFTQTAYELFINNNSKNDKIIKEKKNAKKDNQNNNTENCDNKSIKNYENNNEEIYNFSFYNNQAKNNSSIISSQFSSNLNKDNISQVNIDQNISFVSPSPSSIIAKKKDDIISDFLNRKQIFPFNSEKYFIYDNIYYGEDKIKNLRLKKNISDYKIIEFIKIISVSDKPVEYFQELSNSFYIEGGHKNDLKIYDNEYNEKIKIYLNDWPYNVIEKSRYCEKTKKISLLCCSNELFQIISLDTQTFKTEMQEYQIPKRTITNCIQMKENNMIIIGHGGASYFIDLFNEVRPLAIYKIINNTYRGGIKINDQIVVLTSNSIIPNGEDKLLFYNIQTKKIENIIEGYSFTVSNNNLVLMPREEIKTENKILLCACSKYRKGQKNGILLVNPKADDCKRIENEFYDTDNFEVYCLCPLLNFEYNNNKTINKKSKPIDSNYFFVGGFDLDKRIGIIKLFKILYIVENICKTKINFIQDIEVENNLVFFDRPISCINQSKETGDIFVTCYNGRTYLFTPPNIKSFLRSNKVKTTNK